MYEFHLKRSRHSPVPKDVEEVIDRMMNRPFIRIPEGQTTKKLGIHAKELKKRGLLKIYKGPDETIACLTINNFVEPNSILKISGRSVKYRFKNTLTPKNYLELL